MGSLCLTSSASQGMGMGEQTVEVFLYARSLENSKGVGGSSSTSISSPLASVLPSGTAFKHWGVVVKIENSDGTSYTLYEANNKKGKLEARSLLLGPEMRKEDWEDKPGFEKISHGICKDFDSEAAADFVNKFNARDIDYAPTKENCQQFANEFLSHLTLDKKIWDLITAETALHLIA